MSAHPRIRRQQLLRQAEGYLELGMPAHAIEVLDRWEPQDVPSSRAAYLRGEALRELKRYAEAVVSLNLAAEGLPDEVPIYVALGWCFKRLGRIDLAIEALERGLAADPNAAILPYNLACYWSLAGNKRQALLLLSQAISLDAEFRNLVDSEPDFDADPDRSGLPGADQRHRLGGSLVPLRFLCSSGLRPVASSLADRRSLKAKIAVPAFRHCDFQTEGGSSSRVLEDGRFGPAIRT